MNIAPLLGAAALALSGAGIAFLALCAWLAGRFAHRQVPASGGTAAVTILKPLHGAEPGLAENLRSFVDQDYPGPVRIVFGVERASDPSVAVVETLRREHPGRDLVLVVDATAHGTNGKVSNLINMSPEIRGEVVVLADSDMRVAPDYLVRLAGELARPGTGAVTCPYHGLPGGNGWSRLAALAIDTHFLPGVVAGASLRMAEPCMGSTIALGRETLEAIGGFAPLRHALADDYELGAAVRRLGLAVAVAPFTIGHVCPESRLLDLLAQELRWSRTVRQVAPAGHLGSLVAHPLPFALLGLALLPGLPALAVVFAALAARLGLCLAVERAFGLKAHRYGLLPLRDLLSFAVFVASFLGRGVSWRGNRFRVAPTGALLNQARSGSP